ncbi:hypothetical protein O181_042005 [Austropuccinia psidii MF-1]|uniref:Uncharacterized protein n=1 Tax=Austropuccinia psidii MF-1 TaxID=1389203 RepID=A0A9Q3DFW6_9BASI|nr:hypothetical protein [Austropuccinia psidii MF-1]
MKVIATKFDIKYISVQDLLLGVKATHYPDHVSLDQQHLMESSLDLYGMSDCKPVATPLLPNEHLSAATNDEVSTFAALGVSYRSAIGSINYLSTATCHQLPFSIP